MEYDNLEGKPVDQSKFNLYDRNGTITEFVVWPALLLHKNDPILAKGVSQRGIMFFVRKSGRSNYRVVLDCDKS
jgi:hypothetical protein